MSSSRGTSQVATGRGRRRGRSNEGAEELPRCPQGMSCPYRNEYQHNLEFSHSYLTTPSSSSSTDPFTGTGHRLGESFSRSTSSGTFEEYGIEALSPQPRENKRVRKATTRHPVDDRRNAGQIDHRGEVPFDNVHGSPPLSFVTCGICNERVGLDSLDRHMLLHDKQKENQQLQRNQDQEYADSVLQEVLRSSEELEQQRQTMRAKQMQEASAHLRQAMEISLHQRQIEARDKARASLLPEPSEDCSDTVITLRFTLPTGQRLMRRFRANRSMEDCFDFLRTLDELYSQNFYLKETVGAKIFRLSSSTLGTFLEEGLRVNTSLVVVIDDEPPQVSVDLPVLTLTPPLPSLEPAGPALRSAIEIVDLT